MTDMNNIDLDNLTDEELKNLDLPALQESMNEQAHQESAEESSTKDLPTQNTAEQDEAADATASEVGDESNHQQEHEQADTDATTDTDSTIQQESDTDTQVDYKAFYETMTKPFKANGREIQVSNPDDMIALMQQGANYSKKMAQLKPNLATLKLLEQKGLTDKDKLGYLLDLYDKKPEAIARLVKEADIDLYSFDTEQAEGYTPQEVNEPTEVENIISELYDSSENFAHVLKDITGTWDTQSKELVSKNPQVLYALAQQADSGLYQQINEAVEYERMLGRMTHIPYLEAYSMVEARILAANQPQQTAPQEFVAPRPTQNQNTPASDTNDKKRKAITPKSGGNTQMNDFDPLKMSDAEFLKFYEQQQFH